MYKYKLINEHASSDKYGNCEICGKYTDSIYHQIEYKKYNQGYFINKELWGHKECLLKQRKLKEYIEELTDEAIDNQGDIDDDFNERSEGIEKSGGGPMTNWG